MKKSILVALVIAAILTTVTCTQITIFVIPPVKALPEGKTVIITRTDKTKFIDSPDAMCERTQGGVNFLCRGMAMDIAIENSTTLMRLPYNSWLYGISTGGKTYIQ